MHTCPFFSEALCEPEVLHNAEGVVTAGAGLVEERATTLAENWNASILFIAKIE